MKIIYAYIVLIFLFFSSCHGGKQLATDNFIPIAKFSELNGTYINEEYKLNDLLNIHNRQFEIRAFDIDFTIKDSLIISYVDAVGYKRVALKGKEKKGFFEIYLENMRTQLFPILLINITDRLRIGKDKDNKLLIYKWSQCFSRILFYQSGDFDDEYQHSFSRYDKNIEEGLYAKQVGEKWGYSQSRR